MFREARELGDYLVVIVNNDNWLRKKKGYVLIPEAERAAIISHFPYVDEVIITEHSDLPDDMSVCHSLEKVRPHVFANGGDRLADNVPEHELCKRLGIETVFNVGGGKVQSSSSLVQLAFESKRTTQRPWGYFIDHQTTDLAHIKTLHIHPTSRLSLQKHAQRTEYWMLVSGDAQATLADESETLTKTALVPHTIFVVPQGSLHRLESENGGTVLEVTSGIFDEEDIERLEDDFGRVDTAETKIPL